MQALLSFQQAPPIAAPFRFFLTAPLFAVLAGLLLLSSGPEVFASRWTPAALALTHLITAGFMLQVMLGAMIQILPVFAAANMAYAWLVVPLVHATVTLGALLLTGGLLGHHPLVLRLAALLLGSGVAVFVAAAAHALYAAATTNRSDPSIRGLQLALLGLSVSTALGMLLAVALAGSLALPLLQLTSIHLAWGFAGWGLILLSAVAFIVVPMFQMTPPYPAWFARHFAWVVLALLCCWSVSERWPGLSAGLAGALVLAVAAFAVLTLQLQRRSKRAKRDATQHYWRLAMLCTLAASAFWFGATAVPEFAERQQWLCGVLALAGGFMSVMIGMLYKIVPFLVWLHLQNLGGGRVLAPNMNKVIAARQIEHQLHAHFLALALLLAAVFWPGAFAYPAGLALLIAHAWLLRNLLTAVRFYRQNRSRMATLTPAQAAAGSAR
jgi:hypothetical protein